MTCGPNLATSLFLYRFYILGGLEEKTKNVTETTGPRSLEYLLCVCS